MSDDWRLRVDLQDGPRAFELARNLEASELGHDLQTALGDRIAVSHDQGEVFCYAGTREQAERARDLISTIAAREGWAVKVELGRWHPEAERWEDPDAPLPSTPDQVSAEHEELIDAERKEEAETGEADFEVRVECSSHHDARALSERLTSEGIPHVRRWRYLVIGATDEDSARKLASRIETESPSGSIVRIEGTTHLVTSVMRTNPFSIFGGLGG